MSGARADRRGTGAAGCNGRADVSTRGKRAESKGRQGTRGRDEQKSVNVEYTVSTVSYRARSGVCFQMVSRWRKTTVAGKTQKR